jgi:hypothetical protein
VLTFFIEARRDGVSLVECHQQGRKRWRIVVGIFEVFPLSGDSDSGQAPHTPEPQNPAFVLPLIGMVQTPACVLYLSPIFRAETPADTLRQSLADLGKLMLLVVVALSHASHAFLVLKGVLVIVDTHDPIAGTDELPIKCGSETFGFLLERLDNSSDLQKPASTALDAHSQPFVQERFRLAIGLYSVRDREMVLNVPFKKIPSFLTDRAHGRSVDGKSTEEFYADLSMVGYTTTSRAEKSLRFSDLSISLAGLEEWRWSDVLIAGEETQDGENRSRTITYADPLREYELKEGMLSLRSDVHCSALEGVSYREIRLSQHDSLDYRRTQATTAEAMQQEFTHIEQFLALLTGTYYSLDWPQISIERRGQLERYQLYFWRDIERGRKPEMTNLWTTFPQLQLKFGQLYDNWREKRRKYGPGFYLFLGSLRSREMYVEHRFANLVWGVESLHRGMTTPPGVSRSHRKRIDSILAKAGTELSGDERKWLISERNKRIEPPLSQRIFSTFKGLPWKVTETTLRSFAEKCAARRNDVSHFGGPRTRRDDYNLFLRELMELTAGLTQMYHAALLQEIGLDGKALLDCAKMPIGFRIRHDLKLARLETEEMKAAEPPNLDELQKFQRDAIRKWRRRQTRATKKTS